MTLFIILKHYIPIEVFTITKKGKDIKQNITNVEKVTDAIILRLLINYKPLFLKLLKVTKLLLYYTMYNNKDLDICQLNLQA
jgi:hypothetical protein